MFSDSAETKDLSSSDGGDFSRVALPVIREGIGILERGVNVKALPCFCFYVYESLLRPSMRNVHPRTAKAMEDSPASPSVNVGSQTNADRSDHQIMAYFN